ncbi:MAG: 30S ribosomal protein S6 [Candidatus Harrisonbacteria bacterium]|nr:30S ribosomal protein S6 [Candidatus Harrisonbacteria bacterium]
MEAISTEKQASTLYEIGFLLHLSSSSELIKDALTKAKADIVKEGPVRAITLAYPVEKQAKAEFGYIHFRLEDPQDTANISEALRFNNEVLRTLIVRLPEQSMVRSAKGRKNTLRTKSGESAEEKKEERVRNLDSLSNEALEEKLEELVQ